MKNELVVLSVGGSLIAPSGPDPAFLRNFVEFLHKHIATGTRFAIITGGGKTARQYQEGLSQTRETSQADLDQIGIYATRLNAQLLRLLLSELAYETIIEDPSAPIATDQSVIIGGGSKPGWSTDYVSVCLAENLGAKKVINLSNIDFAYTADPKKDPNATPIKETNWKEFRKILPENWAPGLSSPFDPVAAKKAEELGIEVAIINGTKLEEIEKYLSGQPFVGTVVRP